MRISFLQSFTFMGALLISTFGQAQSSQTCVLTKNSHANFYQDSGETPVIQIQLTEEALVYFRQQFYLQGYLNQSLNQFCGWGEPLSSQLAFILSHVIASTQDPSLDIRILVDEQLSPYTFESRSATIWVQGVEQKMALPGIRPISRRLEVNVDGYNSIDATLPDVIGATYFALAQLHSKGQPYELVKTIKAESQAGLAISYRLTLELKLGTETDIHHIVVSSRPWLKSWDLVSDTLISKTGAD